MIIIANNMIYRVGNIATIVNIVIIANIASCNSYNRGPLRTCTRCIPVSTVCLSSPYVCVGDSVGRYSTFVIRMCII